MNWISNVVRPKIQNLWSKRESPENLWVKCPETGAMVFHKDLEANQFVFPESGHHQRIDARTRCRLTFDNGTYETVALPEVAIDPLRFRDERRYTDRLKAARAKTGMQDAVMVTYGSIRGVPAVVAVQDFDFMGGSLGMAAGEAFVTAAQTAVDRNEPFILFAASGGARMQEGILSLMQLPRTTAAVEQVREAGLPYIVVLTNPTTGGVTASYAMLGDIHIAEPNALIGFAGPRVIEQTIREKLPEGFQRSEYLMEHGMVDMVVHRHDLPETVARLCRLLLKMPAEIQAKLDETDLSEEETVQQISDAMEALVEADSSNRADTANGGTVAVADPADASDADSANSTSGDDATDPSKSTVAEDSKR